MDRISIEHLSVFGLPPVEFVNLTADLGCQYMSIALSPIMPFNPHNYPRFSLKDDPALRREMVAALRDRGVTITLGSGFVLQSESNLRDYTPHFEALSELGVKRINSVSFDPDRTHGFDNLGKLAEMAATFGMETTVEYMPVPGMLLGDMSIALAAVRHVGRRDFRLMIDTLHHHRAGGTAADIAALDPELIGYAQLCDGPLVCKFAKYEEELSYYRMVPGAGELPLFDMLAALPRHVVVGLEIPMRAEAEAGMGPYDRMLLCVEGTRQLLSRLDKGK